MTQANAVVLVMVAVFFTAIGQVLVKYGATDMPPFPKELVERAWFMFRLMTSIPVLLGMATAFAAACCWVLAMTKLPLSVGYPMMALSFPTVAFLAWAVFGERISITDMAGTGLIFAGIILTTTR